MTKARPRLNPQASAAAAVSAKYGPAVFNPVSEGGSDRPSQMRNAAAARIPPGTHNGRAALNASIT